MKAMEIDRIETRIHVIRGQRVILDVDLAAVYSVTTKRLNEQVKRNATRFPPDFLFRLSVQEVDGIKRSQIATGSQKHRDPRVPPLAFTEHGAIMAATILNSREAVDASVFVVRAFVKLRSTMTDTGALARKLGVLERELRGRLDIHETAIVDILRRVMDLLDPAPGPEPPRRRIGFRSSGSKGEDAD